MRLEIDENMPASSSRVLTRHGHDVETVYQEQLVGAPDARLASVCRDENRILISLDLDFANIRAYPPSEYPGIIVLRPRTQSAIAVNNLVDEFLRAAHSEDPRGALWVIEPGRIRISKGVT